MTSTAKVAVTTDGQVLSWGIGKNGRLGLGRGEGGVRDERWIEDGWAPTVLRPARVVVRDASSRANRSRSTRAGQGEENGKRGEGGEGVVKVVDVSVASDGQHVLALTDQGQVSLPPSLSPLLPPSLAFSLALSLSLSLSLSFSLSLSSLSLFPLSLYLT